MSINEKGFPIVSSVAEAINKGLAEQKPWSLADSEKIVKAVGSFELKGLIYRRGDIVDYVILK